MHKYKNILILILLVFNLLLLYKSYFINPGSRKPEEPSQITSLRELQIFRQLESENKMIKNFITYDNQNQKKTIKNYVNADPKVILRLPVTTCEKCSADQLKAIQALAEKIGNDNIIILFSAMNQRELQLIKNEFNIETLFLNIASPLGLPSEKYKRPYYFMLDTALKASLIYFPETNNTIGLSKYFTILSDRFYINSGYVR